MNPANINGNFFRLQLQEINQNPKEKKNSVPGHVWFVAQQVAFFKEVPVEDVLKANRDNVTELYKIPPWHPLDGQSQPQGASKTLKALRVLKEEDKRQLTHSCNGVIRDKPKDDDNNNVFDTSKSIHTCNGTISVTRSP